MGIAHHKLTYIKYSNKAVIIIIVALTLTCQHVKGSKIITSYSDLIKYTCIQLCTCTLTGAHNEANPSPIPATNLPAKRRIRKAVPSVSKVRTTSSQPTA